MTTARKEFLIQGITADGKTFRPSDWAERLCGVMSQFRPEDADPHHHLSYSPLVRPTLVGGIKGVIVDERLRDIEPMALSFVLSFAKDNGLQVSEICSLPDIPAKN